MNNVTIKMNDVEYDLLKRIISNINVNGVHYHTGDFINPKDEFVSLRSKIYNPVRRKNEQA